MGHVKSLAGALRVLRLFTAANPEWSVTQISRAMQLEKSRVSKILSEFVAQGYLDKDLVSRRYRVGSRAYEFGAGYLSMSSLMRCGDWIVRDLVERTGFYATLNIFVGDSVLFASGIRGTGRACASLPVGTFIPLHATAAGKTAAAYLPKEKLDQYLQTGRLVPLTQRSIRDPLVLRHEIDEVRAAGYAMTRGESTPGVAAIAAPVLDAKSHYVGAVSLLCPLAEVTTQRQRELVSRVVDSATRISAQL
jgi:DNA-binding IclR family transcriptional regulator